MAYPACRAGYVGFSRFTHKLRTGLSTGDAYPDFGKHIILCLRTNRYRRCRGCDHFSLKLPLYLRLTCRLKRRQVLGFRGPITGPLRGSERVIAELDGTDEA